MCCFINPAHISAQNGIVKTYYDNGNVESEISYVNDILDGISFYYYINGNLREEIPMSYGKLHGIKREYFQSGLIKEERNLREGVLDGLSKIFYENGALKEALSYENGKLTKRIKVPFDSSYSAPLELYLAGNRQYKLSKEANIISDVEICPVPVNGIKEIQKNLLYPEETRQAKTEGIVTLSVKIDTLGKATLIEVLKSLDSKCDLAAANAVEKTKFLPGRNGNKAVDSKIVINVEFKIENQIVLQQEYAKKVKKEVDELITPIERKLDTTKPVAKEEVKTEKKINEVAASNNVQPVLINKNEVKKPAIINVPKSEVEKEDTPFPIGGIERIIARMVVPKKAVEQKISGDIVFRVEVDKYGVVRETKIIKSLGAGIDEAVEVAILDSPFRPAKINGQNVKAQVILTIPFNYLK